MSVYSMTGFATVAAKPGAGSDADADTASRPTAAVTVEIRTVNSRFLDVSYRMPDELRAIEPALRELLTAALKRGKVELRISAGREADAAMPEPTPELMHRLTRIESTVLGWSRQAQPLTVNEILHWCRSAPPAPRAADDTLLEAARRCITELKEARAREGAKLSEILMQRVQLLRSLATQAAPMVAMVVKRQQERFVERWNEALQNAGAGATIPAEAMRERALGEATAYALRIDVAEELSRLSAHLSEIERLLAKGGEVGKRLEFLIQELQREANTLGSKSAALELSSIAVDMKVAIEQMREQVQNVE